MWSYSTSLQFPSILTRTARLTLSVAVRTRPLYSIPHTLIKLTKSHTLIKLIKSHALIKLIKSHTLIKLIKSYTIVKLIKSHTICQVKSHTIIKFIKSHAIIKLIKSQKGSTHRTHHQFPLHDVDLSGQILL